MNGRKVRFRNALSGYNKDDVNACIEEMNAMAFRAEEEFGRRTAELEKRLSYLENEVLAERENELKALKESLRSAESLIAEMTESMERLKGEKEALEREKTELGVRISEYERSAESNEELYEKSSKYDKVSEQIGSMIVSANARAESIVSEAELKARVASKIMLDETLEMLSEMNEKYTGEIIAKTVQLTEQMRGLSLEAESFRMGLNTAVEADGIKIKEALESKKRVITEDNNG